MPKDLSSYFVVYHKESSLWVSAKAQLLENGNAFGYLGPREKADYFDSERDAMEEVKWLQKNDYLPKEGTFAAIPYYDSVS